MIVSVAHSTVWVNTRPMNLPVAAAWYRFLATNLWASSIALHGRFAIPCDSPAAAKVTAHNLQNLASGA